jgi:hypothetical protein
MQITAKHREVETGFRLLLADNEMAPPDRVGYEPEAVVFFFDAPKLAVVVDFDEATATSRPAGGLEGRGGARPGTSDEPDQGGL